MAPSEKNAQKKTCNVLGSDMEGSMQEDVINICYAAMEKGGGDNDIAKK